MATVFVPSMMRRLSGGEERVEVAGHTLREVVDNLERHHPGFKAVLVENGRARPGLAFAVNGVTQSTGLMASVDEDAEIHILPAIGGGTGGGPAAP